MKQTFYIIFLGLAVISSCSESEIEAKTERNTEVEKSDLIGIFNQNPIKSAYTLDYNLEELDGKTYKLEVNIDVEEGSWFVSPLSAEGYRGHYQLIIPDNAFVTKGDFFSEIPAAIEEIDPFRNEPYHIIKDRTTYTYHLDLSNEENFSVTGYSQFVIEPICMLQKVSFVIERVDGKTSIRKVLNRDGC